MKIGDEVSIKSGEKYKDYNGRYEGTIGTVKHVGIDYCEVCLFDGKIAMFPNCHIEPYVKTRSGVRKCTCGAANTSFPKHHYDWCDIHMIQVTISEELFDIEWNQPELPFTD